MAEEGDDGTADWGATVYLRQNGAEASGAYLRKAAGAFGEGGDSEGVGEVKGGLKTGNTSKPSTFDTRIKKRNKGV